MVTRRWDPFSGMVSLRDAMDRLLEQSFISPHRSISTDLPGARIMSIDLYERDGDYVMKAYVPGVKVEDIEIHVDRGTLLTIKARVGGKAEQEEAKKYEWLVSELDWRRSLPQCYPAHDGRCEQNRSHCGEWRAYDHPA